MKCWSLWGFKGLKCCLSFSGGLSHYVTLLPKIDCVTWELLRDEIDTDRHKLNLASRDFTNHAINNYF